jgi:hypothetical protein
MSADISDLVRKIEDPDVPLGPLRKRLAVDPSRSRAFAPAVVVNVETRRAAGVDEFTPTAGSIADSHVRRRQEKYRRKIAAGWDGLKFVAEGDSWFEFPILLKDIIAWLEDEYAIFTVSEAGDTLTNMKLGIQDLINLIGRERSHGFLLSGGGNDFLEPTKLTRLLRVFNPNFQTAQDYLIMHRFNESLAQIIADYRFFFDALTAEFATLKLFCHGYDWVVPQFSGTYLWPVMEEREIPVALRPKITKLIVNFFNDALKQLAAEERYGGRVVYVDCRGRVGNAASWFDEIHPRNAGFGRVAGRFRRAFNDAFAGVA